MARLERCGFKMLGITADAASSNRCFYKLHQKQSHLDSKIVNLHAPERNIFFFSYPPHLIKTVRNCRLNRRMWVSERGGGSYVIEFLNIAFSAMEKRCCGHISRSCTS